MIKDISTLAILSAFLISICGCSGRPQTDTSQPEVDNSLVQIDEDGTMTEVRPLDKVEGLLSVEELIAKQDELASALEELDPIEEAMVVLSYRPEDAETLCFQVSLFGEDLEEHADEISELVEETLGPCDLEHSSIMDVLSAVDLLAR